MGKDPDLIRRRVTLFDGDSPMGVVNEELRFAYFDSNVAVRCQRFDEEGTVYTCTVTFNEHGVLGIETDRWTMEELHGEVVPESPPV